MIYLQGEVWRPDCIAAMGLHKKVIQVLPTGCREPKMYYYNDAEEATRVFKILLVSWMKAIEGGAA